MCNDFFVDFGDKQLYVTDCSNACSLFEVCALKDKEVRPKQHTYAEGVGQSVRSATGEE